MRGRIEVRAEVLVGAERAADVALALLGLALKDAIASPARIGDGQRVTKVDDFLCEYRHRRSKCDDKCCGCARNLHDTTLIPDP